MKKKLRNPFLIALTLFLLVIFIIKVGGPSILRLYVESGMGNCQQIPIFCKEPTEEINNPVINKEYLAELTLFKFHKAPLEIYLPRYFNVVQGEIKKTYFKKMKVRYKKSTAYLLYRRPNFFTTLFPQITKNKIKNDYDFVSRVMYAKTNNITNITDAFFVIMKGIFTPDLGDQMNIKMVKFTINDKKGFLNYNFTPAANYFDGNIINDNGEFIKVYIKDAGHTLDLDKVLAIISTVNSDTIKKE